MKKERRIARELALQYLFPVEVGGEPDPHLEMRLQGCGDEVCSYARFLVDGIRERRKELDEVLSRSSRKSFKDLLPIEKVILRLGAFEIMSGLKPSIAINEAVELAKKYGEPSSFKLINAVLDTLAKSLKEV